MNYIIELNDEFESSPYIGDEMDFKKNIFENESISNFYSFNNDFLLSLMSSNTLNKNEINYLDYNMEIEDYKEDNKFYLNLNLDLDEDKINENKIYKNKQKKINKNKKKNNRTLNLITKLYKEDNCNNQFLRNIFIQYLNQKRIMREEDKI